MKPFRLLILCLLAVSLNLAACAPTPTPYPLNSAAAQPTATEVPPTLTATATATATQTPSPTPTPSITLTARPTHTLTPSLTPTETRTPWPTNAPSLSTLAKRRDFYIGAAVQASLLAEESLYRETILKEFNILTTEQEMSMCDIWPERERWNFDASDALLNFAQENRIRVRGRSLIVGDGCIPDWITTGKFTPAEASAILQKYITTLVGRYKGKIAYWVVLNNDIDRPPIWENLIGTNYVNLAFEWAHAADPWAKLFYSDHSVEVMNDKSDFQYDFLKNLQYWDVPIKGVELQMPLNAPIEIESVKQNIGRINELGLEVHITEFSIGSIAGATDADQQQAIHYQEILKVCLKARNCPVFLMGGFTDKYTYPDQPGIRPLIFDDQYQPKPAYEALYLALR